MDRAQGPHQCSPHQDQVLAIDLSYFILASLECSRLTSRLLCSTNGIWMHLPTRNELVSFWISPSGAPSVPAPSPTTHYCGVTRGSRAHAGAGALASPVLLTRGEKAATSSVAVPKFKHVHTGICSAHASSTFAWAGRESSADRFSLAALSI